MSALGHYLESAGIATICISLFRPHSERIRPPRTLWVPFELGRPLGEPGDGAFQRLVLSQALGLLEQVREPGLIMDFPRQAAGFADDPAWQPPALPAGPNGSRNPASLRDALAAEQEAIAPVYRQAVASRGRTTVGNSALPAERITEFLCAMASGTVPENPMPEQRLAIAMRLAADDLKAQYLEAASMGGRPSSRQLQHWFWDTTTAAQVLIRLRATAMASDDKILRAVAGGQLIPAEQRVRLGL
ncbi:MAG: hypothetical protein JJT90_00985 [Ectothiorhodospiraceae bacterium]|nr:hypothetical protein [Ectothiorhodospiraceae bacterium]